MKFSFLAFAFAALTSVASADHPTENFSWSFLDTQLPKALSDHTAAVGSDGLIYIGGGCDAENGNEWIPPAGEEDGFFSCASLSTSFYSFDSDTGSFATLQSLPRARYRHSMSVVGNQVWFVGGRTIEDALISEIDVYDIAAGSWTTVTLPAEFQVSDHAGFSQEPNFVFIAGGYDGDYVAQATLARIDTSTIDDTSLTIEAQSPLITARGDIIGITATDGSSAFISGGFTHDNNFCAPLGSTEEYVFSDDQWNGLPELVNERGEVVLVEVENHLYALGGERQIEGYCEGVGEDLDPGEQTVGTDEVEIYEPDADAWKVISGFPDHKFRFAAAVGKDGFIYAFGGQTALDLECQCFKTTNDVQVFGNSVEAASPAKLSTLLTLGALVATLML